MFCKMTTTNDPNSVMETTETFWMHEVCQSKSVHEVDRVMNIQNIIKTD